MVEYIVAIDVTRARFPADAYGKLGLSHEGIGAFPPNFRALRGVRGLLRRWINRCADGSIAQWLERLTADQQVPGSNPGWPFARFTQVARLSA